MLRMQMVDDIEADQNVLLKIRNGAWSFVTLEGGTLQIMHYFMLIKPFAFRKCSTTELRV